MKIPCVHVLVKDLTKDQYKLARIMCSVGYGRRMPKEKRFEFYCSYPPGEECFRLKWATEAVADFKSQGIPAVVGEASGR